MIKLESYTFVLLSSILAIMVGVPGVLLYGLGLPLLLIGRWSLRVLRRPEVKLGFLEHAEDLERSRKLVGAHSLPAPPAVALPQSTPSPVSSPSLNPPALVSTQETERFRRFRLFTRLSQLLQCHLDVANMHVGFVVLGILATLGGVVFAIIVGAEISWRVGLGIGLVTGVLTGLGLAIASVWLCSRFARKAQVRAQQKLAGKIEELLTEFPHECQGWGGASVLREAQLVPELLREVDPALAEQLLVGHPLSGVRAVRSQTR
jgi:hypothetical protein